eukprot:TRINITY_DN3610_c0_g2_i6.p1 TRINITY_DN3610_c0_g2~~TRINITY_DN3610_c0_g2_i6.p1  ORF type:complete len:712 (+),score=120.71 TRINITY_DN3610_c0_g2_i6:213-2348(+)
MSKLIQLILLNFLYAFILGYHKGKPHSGHNAPNRRKYEDTLGCLVVPNFTLAMCGTPFELTNYLDEDWCLPPDKEYYEDNEIYREPRKIIIEYIVDGHHAHSMAAAYPRVRIAGTGFSNYQKQFCPEDGFETSAMVTTHTLYVADLYEEGYLAMRKALDAEDWDWQPVKHAVEISGKKMQVKVASGMPLRFLLERLAEEKYVKLCRLNGCTLSGDYPALVDATVGGLVVSGSHGSSIQHGSFSNHVRELVVVRGYDLSQKTLEITKKSHPMWYAAYKTSVGIIGMVEYITLDIEPRKMVDRQLTKLDLDKFIAGMVSIQQCYKDTIQTSNFTSAQVGKALQAINGHTHFYWVPYTQHVYQLNFTEREDERQKNWHRFFPDRRPDEKALEKVTTICPFMEGEVFDAIMKSKKNIIKKRYNPPLWRDFSPELLLNMTGKWWQEQQLVDQTNIERWNIINQWIILTQFQTYSDLPKDEAYQELNTIYRIIDLYKNNGSFNPGWNLPTKYWEISIPLEMAGECLQQISNFMYDSVEYSNFRFPLTIRFQGKEDIYLSHSVDGARMYIQTESWMNWFGLQYRDSSIYRLFEMLYMECDGRLHWTSEAWNAFEQCFDGYDRFGDYWCNFGCALRETDNEGAWATQSPIWKFFAEDDTGEVLTEQGLGRCCIGGYGFASYKCQCIANPDFQGKTYYSFKYNNSSQKQMGLWTTNLFVV